MFGYYSGAVFISEILNRKCIFYDNTIEMKLAV